MRQQVLAAAAAAAAAPAAAAAAVPLPPGSRPLRPSRGHSLGRVPRSFCLGVVCWVPGRVPAGFAGERCPGRSRRPGGHSSGPLQALRPAGRLLRCGRAPGARHRRAWSRLTSLWAIAKVCGAGLGRSVGRNCLAAPKGCTLCVLSDRGGATWRRAAAGYPGRPRFCGQPTSIASVALPIYSHCTAECVHNRARNTDFPSTAVAAAPAPRRLCKAVQGRWGGRGQGTQLLSAS